MFSVLVHFSRNVELCESFVFICTFLYSFSKTVYAQISPLLQSDNRMDLYLRAAAVIIMTVLCSSLHSFSQSVHTEHPHFVLFGFIVYSSERV